MKKLFDSVECSQEDKVRPSTTSTSKGRWPLGHFDVNPTGHLTWLGNVEPKRAEGVPGPGIDEGKNSGSQARKSGRGKNVRLICRNQAVLTLWFELAQMAFITKAQPVSNIRWAERVVEVVAAIVVEADDKVQLNCNEMAKMNKTQTDLRNSQLENEAQEEESCACWTSSRRRWRNWLPTWRTWPLRLKVEDSPQWILR